MFYFNYTPTLDLSNLNLSSVNISENTYRMFYGCSAKTIYVSSSWLSKFKEIDSSKNFVVK